MSYILSIDQGTTSSRAIVFDSSGRACGQAQKEFRQHFPHDGWVEHDAMEIWNDTLALCQQALRNARVEARQLAAIGITNQRETTVLWDRRTGDPLAKAIVWQDRRTASACQSLRDAGHEDMVRNKTGLLLDPYFSATKLAWQLTRGKVHATDATNASRTLLFNIHEQVWDTALLELFDIPAAVLPEVRDSAGEFGSTCPELLGAAVPVAGIAGDQQAALVGQACFQPGMVKSTYGTGCFMVMNTGEAVESHNRLLTTVGYRLNGKTTYALEGSIFVAGAAIQWLRDGLNLIRDASETEALARRAGSAGGVYLVPAFTGLGAPWWDPHARGALLGLTRDTGIAEVVTAGLEAVCYQSRDLLDAMAADCGTRPTTLRVDGGMVVNNWLSQTLADVLGVCVDRPMVTETTALGAAYLAGLGVGLYDSLDAVAEQWRCEREFTPLLEEGERQRRYQGWREAVARVCQSPAGE